MIGKEEIILFLEAVQYFAECADLLPFERGIVANIESEKVHVLASGKFLCQIPSHKISQVRLSELIPAPRGAPSKLHSVRTQRSHDLLTEPPVCLPEH